MIRDIPSTEIVVGNKVTNLREEVERRLGATGRRSRDIRAREIRRREVGPGELALRITCYDSSVGEERFLEMVTPDDRLAAFLRLTLPHRAADLEELEGRALLREVHVYGPALGIGRDARAEAQHRGLGSRLVSEAARQCAASAGAGSP